MTTTSFNNIIQSGKGPPANEQDVGCVDLNILLIGMLTSALRWHIANRTFQNFQQSLLHTFPGNISGDLNVLRLAPDLIDFIHIDDPAFSSFHIVVRILQKTQDNIFHVIANITGLG